MPYTLFEALRNGAIFAKFQEMPEDESPPRNIWTNSELLGEHFEKVKRQRESRFKGGGNDDIHEEIEDGVDNDAASMLIDENA